MKIFKLPGLLPMRRSYARGLFLVAISLASASSARAQISAYNIYPQSTCVEYYTAPGKSTYLAHYSYLNTGVPVAIPPGFPQNYFAPGPTYPGQISRFLAGYNQVIPPIPISYARGLTWVVLAWDDSASPLTYDPNSSDSTDPDPTVYAHSPACKPSFVPAPLTFAQPGTYTHQFLGQVNAGPVADSTTTVSVLSTGGSVALSNLTYVSTDPANPTSTENPNSIYGDVTVTSTGGTTNFLVQLQVGNAAVTDGLVPVTY
jgi:hypothetical protein